jgi:hypothetical protein
MGWLGVRDEFRNWLENSAVTGVGHGSVERADDEDRRVERLVRLFLNHGSEAFADTAGPRVFLNNEDAAAMTRHSQ